MLLVTRTISALPKVGILLILDRYLYERENYNDALEMIQTTLESFENKENLAYASAVDLSGLLQLDNAHPSAALEEFEIALKIREAILGPDDAFIASSLNNIAMAYTELNDLPRAHSYHSKAIDIRLRTNSDRIGNSYSNMSSTLLRMGQPDEAEEMLARCPSLKDFNDETFLKSGNPRFSGDMVLLSRIRAKQGRLDDAIRLSSKALAFRQSMLGNRLKTCDALYLIASQLQQRDNIATAVSLLDECVSIAENLPEGKGYDARAKFKLGSIYASHGELEKSRTLKAAARSLKRELTAEEGGEEEGEEDYAKFCVWMLW